MRTIPVLAGLIAAAAIAAPALAQDQRSAPRLDRYDLEAWVDGFLPYALQRGDVAGAVVVVVTDGDVLLQKGYGYADVANQTPVDPERTLFRAGSVAKLFTWTAIMQLVESGKLDLDRNINEYLDFPIPPRDGQPITVRNLMTHTAGFEEVVKNLMTDQPERLLPLSEYLKAWTPGRIFPPGKVPAYSNYAVALAGYIIERVSGEIYDDYLDYHVLTPLGMTNSTSRQPLPARFTHQMSKGYRLGSGPEGPYEVVGPAPAGALAATGADMGRFMIAYLQNGASSSTRILNPETVRIMHGTALPIVPPLNSMLLGFYQRHLNGRRIVAHDGDTQFFHSALSLFPDEGVGVYLSLNSTGREGAAGPIRTALLEQFVDRYFPAPADNRSVDPKIAAEHARLMAGTYESSRRAQSTFFSLMYLLLQTKVTVGDDGGLSVPALQGLNGQPKQWREVAPFVWQEVGGKERLAARVENGRVVMFSVDGVSPFLMFQPAVWWKSSAWLVPLLIVALTALVLTVVAWPIGAVVRRRSGLAFDVTGSEVRAYRLIRIAAIAIVVTVAAWGWTVSLIQTDLSAFSPRLDPWIRILRTSSFVVFVGATVIALWNTRLTWTGSRGRLAKLWSMLLAVACLVVLWVAVVARLIGFSTNY